MLLEIIPPPVLDMSITPPWQRTQSLQMLLDSYQVLAKLHIKMAYPGHLNTIKNVNEVIEKQVSRIHRHKEKCFQLISQGVTDLNVVRKAIYPNRNSPPTFLMALGLLDLLQTEGRISVENGTGKLRS